MWCSHVIEDLYLKGVGFCNFNCQIHLNESFKIYFHISFHLWFCPPRSDFTEFVGPNKFGTISLQDDSCILILFLLLFTNPWNVLLWTCSRVMKLASSLIYNYLRFILKTLAPNSYDKIKGPLTNQRWFSIITLIFKAAFSIFRTISTYPTTSTQNIVLY